ncbi:ion channel [Sinomonas susongensis]|uniref:ion channel n=1 Tax=Sinomonas susongensis TaxID=1324851 RepID=UPI003CCC6C57
MGYGDHYPVTAVGRLAAAGLMVAGVAVLGVVTATIASWLVESVSTETGETAAKMVESTAAVLEAIDEPLEDQIRSLREQVIRLTAALEAHQPDS